MIFFFIELKIKLIIVKTLIDSLISHHCFWHTGRINTLQTATKLDIFFHLSKKKPFFLNKNFKFLDFPTHNLSKQAFYILLREYGEHRSPVRSIVYIFTSEEVVDECVHLVVRQ